MNDPRDDRRLSEAFGHLRSALRPLAPDAARSIEAAAQRARRAEELKPQRPESWGPRRSTSPKDPPRVVPVPRFAFAGLLVALATVAVWAAWRATKPALDRPTAARPAAVSTDGLWNDGLWRAPTDFLLEVHGAALLRTTPSIGVALPTFPAATPPNLNRTPADRPARRITT